jgi:hypothetical protein
MKRLSAELRVDSRSKRPSASCRPQLRRLKESGGNTG